MQFIFIDETGCNQKDPSFYALGAAVFNYYTYHKYKEAFIDEFKKLDWNQDIEFKGKYLFSTAGDKNVSIDKRINFVSAIAKHTISKTNSRINFIFCCNNCGNSENNHLDLLEKIVNKIKSNGSGFKRLIGYFLDDNEKIDKKKIMKTISENSSGIIFERPFFIKSDNNLPGLITVDILNYLKLWTVINPTPSGQLSLFGEFKGRDNEKIKAVRDILSSIKNIKEYKV
jgi:hypothetical protein